MIPKTLTSDFRCSIVLDMITYINVPTCPEPNSAGAPCGAQLQVVTDGEVGEDWAPGYYVVGTARPLKMVRRDFLACPRCSFAAVI